MFCPFKKRIIYSEKDDKGRIYLTNRANAHIVEEHFEQCDGERCAAYDFRQPVIKCILVNQKRTS